MKKISYSLRIGIIGDKELIKEIFLESLSKSALESNLFDDNYEFLIVFKQIPIKIKIFFAESLENLIINFEKVQNLDVLFITLNLYNPISLDNIKKHILDEFNERFSFQGLSFLVGMDIQHIFNQSSTKNFKISRFQLEKKTKDLNLIYCFEIFNKNKDINEIYNTLLNDFILRFQYLNHELFETAKEYGKKLKNR
ncbi:MAG: hypothetical protein ACFFDH_15290 [Promethearchaeota archaeon]